MSTEYNTDDIVSVLRKRKRGWSVRKIAEHEEIPKSIVGRWLKNPDEWRQKYQFRDASRNLRKGTKSYKKYVKLKKEILKKPAGRQRELMIYFDDDRDAVVVESP